MSHCAVQNILLVTKNERQPFLSSVPRSTYRWLARPGMARWSTTRQMEKWYQDLSQSEITSGLGDWTRLDGCDDMSPGPWRAGDCSAQGRGGGIPRRGQCEQSYEKSEARSRGRMQPSEGRERIAKGAIVHTPHFLTHSLRSREGLWQGTGGSPWDVRRTTCMKAPWAVGMERRAERATVAEDWKDSLGALDGERPPPFWGHSWFWVIRESMGRQSPVWGRWSFIWAL